MQWGWKESGSNLGRLNLPARGSSRLFDLQGPASAEQDNRKVAWFAIGVRVEK